MFLSINKVFLFSTMQYTKLLILQLSVIFFIFVSDADFSSPVEPPCRAQDQHWVKDDIRPY